MLSTNFTQDRSSPAPAEDVEPLEQLTPASDNEESGNTTPKRLRPRRAMMMSQGDGNYHAGENRSLLASAMPIVEHGRGTQSGGRHCGPTTVPVGVAWGDGLAVLSHALPLTDPHVVRIPKEGKQSSHTLIEKRVVKTVEKHVAEGDDVEERVVKTVEKHVVKEAADDVEEALSEPAESFAVKPSDFAPVEDAVLEEDAESAPARIRARQAMMMSQGDGNYHAGENRSLLASAMPIVEHGRGTQSGGRHCGPTTVPVGVAWGDGLSVLSHALPLTDPHVVRAPASPTSLSARREEKVLTPMNSTGLDVPTEEPPSLRAEESSAFSPMGAYYA